MDQSNSHTSETALILSRNPVEALMREAFSAEPLLQHPVLRLKKLNDDRLMAMKLTMDKHKQKRQ